MIKIIYFLIFNLILLPGILFARANNNKLCSAHSMKYQGADARRIWLASYIPASARDQLLAVQYQLRAMGLSTGYYERPERLHVTILPIGSVMGVKNAQPVHAVADALDKVILKPALVKIKKIEVLTTPSGQPRLVWAVLDSLDLENMHSNIEKSLESFCDIDKKGFKPHITLYRFSQKDSTNALLPQLINNINKINTSAIPDFYIDGFNLLESPKKFVDDFVLLKEYKAQTTQIQENIACKNARLYWEAHRPIYEAALKLKAQSPEQKVQRALLTTALNTIADISSCSALPDLLRKSLIGVIKSHVLE